MYESEGEGVAEMKKLISCLLAVMMFASLTAVPAFAAAVNLEEPVFSCDFEDFDATDDKFFDAEKPDGFPFFVGGSEGGGLQIVENGVGGTNSITYFRAAGTSESTNIRASVDASAYPAETKYVALQFAFRIEKIGDYGFTAAVGNSGTDTETWTPNFLSVKNVEGQIVVNGFNNGTETAAKSGLETNRDYVLTAVFELGTKNYDLYLDDEQIGSFENGVGAASAELTSLNAFRVDGHGMDSPENLLDVVYFDDLKVAAVAEEEPETPVDPGTDEPSVSSTPNTPTGDTMYFAVVVAMAAVLATVLLKKRNNA